MNFRPLLLVAAWFLAIPSIAHEGHDSPGALPPAPHGGVIAEASHKVTHKEDANEDELFFEVVNNAGSLQIYPLGLSPKDTSIFKVLPLSQISSVDLKVEFPRSKKTAKLTAKTGKDSFETKLDGKTTGRFIVHINATHNNEIKVAKVQIEQP